MSKKCEHDWYPVGIYPYTGEMPEWIFRVCRKCWGYQMIAAKWISHSEEEKRDGN